MTVPSRSSKSSQALDALRARLADGTWPVGTRIPGEHELAAELGVGRNTLREALRTLSNQGLLAAKAGDGTYVLATDELAAALERRVTPEEALQALEIRTALEVHASRLAATRITGAEIERLDELTQRRAAASAADDDAAFVRADLAWHECIISACRNPLLSELYSGLDRTATYIRAAGQEPRLHRPADPMDAAHARVMAALRAQDPAAAATAALHLTDISIRLLKEADA